MNVTTNKFHTDLGRALGFGTMHAHKSTVNSEIPRIVQSGYMTNDISQQDPLVVTRLGVSSDKDLL
jgi:hypothetical protein